MNQSQHQEPESKAEIVLRLLKNGGYVLIAGGGITGFVMLDDE